MRNSYSLLILGAVAHLMLLMSVFDIYFTSPIIHGIEERAPAALPIGPAKRLVLFVADGLRIDKCFGGQLSDGEWAAPYIRHLAEKEGVWGRSQTRVPTESRPGHVALLAGFYEDVSAVTRGWKENPVEFDSVLNRSRMAWSWGSPDILHMFAKGSSGSKVFTHTYDEAEEDFADSNPSRLDNWVFDRFEEFILSAKQNSTLRNLVDENQIIFFLHLLGMDTMGHSRKPGSKDYIEGIRVVNDGVERIVKMLENFYNNDGGTAYVFTADHGMTDWGSHGSGDLEETSTPLVTWGAGIRKPLSANNDHFFQAAEWNLSHVWAEDINQADLAPLMSSLIGIQIPVNSVGVVPVQVLSGDLKQKANIFLNNLKQIGAQFLRHWEIKESESFSAFFRPYNLSKSDMESKYELISGLIKENPQEAIVIAKDTVNSLLVGIHYFQTYHRLSLSFTVLTGFFCWMLYLCCWLQGDHFGNQSNSKAINYVIYIGISIVIILLCYAQHYPLTYYFYYLNTAFICVFVYSRIKSLSLIFKEFCRLVTVTNVIGFLLLILSTELLVIVFFKRWFLSIPLLLLSVWPFSTKLYPNSKYVCFSWSLTCLVVAAFPLFPAIGKSTNYSLVLFSGILVIVYCALILTKFQSVKNPELSVAIRVTKIQVVFLILSLMNVWVVSTYIEKRLKVPIFCHIFSWFTFASSSLLPSFVSRDLPFRLLNIALTLFTVFVLFSFTYEALVFVIFIILLTQWYWIESQLDTLLLQETGGDDQMMTMKLNKDDIRRAYFSLLFLMTGYFGLGNVANINSFTVTSVYCFMTVFSPFLMGFLLIWKILIPILAVVSAVRAIQKILERPPAMLFWSILLLSDILVVNFFFLIQDEGSWLEIGSSIGRFVVSTVTSIAFIVLYSVAAFLTHFQWSQAPNKQREHYS